MSREIMTTSVPPAIAGDIEDLVDDGQFANRSDALRFLIREGLTEYNSGDE